MGFDQNELKIRSRNGLLQDLIPIYSYHQFAPNLVALGLIICLSLSIGHFPTGLLPFLMLGWVFQFVSRPAAMTVSKSQAERLELIIGQQGHYDRSDADDRWRIRDVQWWQRLPHLFIEFVPGETVTIIAPRDVMESLRTSLELLEEHSELSWQDDQPFDLQPTESERLPWQTQVPTCVLGIVCVVAWVWHIAAQGLDGMANWGVSAAALRQGRLETILLHMFAHGSALHLVMNLTILAAIGGVLTSRLGTAPLSWLRFLFLYLISGLAGAALYLLAHPLGTVPMVGASGALYGLFGLLIRAPANGESLLSIRSRSWDLIKQNAFLFALLAISAWSNGTAGGLAWEAHLGGFLFGLLVGPKLLPNAPKERFNSKKSCANFRDGCIGRLHARVRR
jgi:membrane associated rhomboid family serine protease